ncbi:hypothetical protein Anapl_01086 [Anas platyrhynchos]|uniref:Uncharacterized protein n=1 Tax=Anas platyrhynchos TaxID=8839 RepID=R0LHK7_ANAPL|nr:hypothetical protein Anapl_01086 [Anas platyrhynchos]
MHSVESNDLEFNKHDPCCVMLNAFLVSLSKPLLRVAAVHECVPRATVVLYMEVQDYIIPSFKLLIIDFAFLKKINIIIRFASELLLLLGKIDFYIIWVGLLIICEGNQSDSTEGRSVRFIVQIAVNKKIAFEAVAAIFLVQLEGCLLKDTSCFASWSLGACGLRFLACCVLLAGMRDGFVNRIAEPVNGVHVPVNGHSGNELQETSRCKPPTGGILTDRTAPGKGQVYISRHSLPAALQLCIVQVFWVFEDFCSSKEVFITVSRLRLCCTYQLRGGVFNAVLCSWIFLILNLHLLPDEFACSNLKYNSAFQTRDEKQAGILSMMLKDGKLKIS